MAKYIIFNVDNGAKNTSTEEDCLELTEKYFELFTIFRKQSSSDA